MKKKLLSSLLIGSLCLALSIPATVYADGQKVVTLGADLSADQKTAVLKYFGILGQNVKTLTITNQDERDHLGAYVPLEQIGSHTYSCALVCPTSSGGIQVKTANLSWVTSNMIASTLSTSGVVNCDVLAASPFEVSGTGALTGIIMAYESASGVRLDPSRVDLANQELVTTGTIANNIGQRQATNIVNEIKIEIIQGQIVEPAQVEEIVNEVVEDRGLTVELSDEDRALLTGLMTQIAQQQYNYEDMEETLQRVDDNVNDLREWVDDQDSTELASGEDETEPETLEADSILVNTDDSALGDNVLIDATNEEAVQNDTAETEEDAGDPFGFDIVSSDSYGDEGEAGDDFTTDWSSGDGETTDDWSFDDGEAEDDWSFDNGEAEDDWSFDDGEAEDDWSLDNGEATDNGEAAGEEAAPDDSGEAMDEIPETESLNLGQYRLVPDSSSDGSQAAGISQYKLLLEDYDLIPVSGTLTVSDSYGNICTTVDLDNTEQVTAASVSAEDMADITDNWTAGSKLLINTGYALQPSESYLVTLDGMVASASNPAVTAGVSTSVQVYTDSCGAVLNISKGTDVYPGAVLSGSLIMDEAAAYAQISDYDDTMISFSNTEFAPEAADFSLSCLQSGTTEFGIDFYDADGNLITTVYYELTILN